MQKLWIAAVIAVGISAGVAIAALTSEEQADVVFIQGEAQTIVSESDQILAEPDLDPEIQGDALVIRAKAEEMATLANEILQEG